MGKAQLTADFWTRDTTVASAPWTYRLKASVLKVSPGGFWVSPMLGGGGSDVEIGDIWYAPNGIQATVKQVGKDGGGNITFDADMEVDVQRFDLFSGTSPAGSPLDGLHRPIVLTTSRPFIAGTAEDVAQATEHARESAKSARGRMDEALEGRKGGGGGVALLLLGALLLIGD